MSTSGENRFAPVTEDNHAAPIWISSLLCLVYSTLVLVMRGWLRRNMYGLDDYLALSASVIQVGEVIAILLGLTHGLGQTQDLLRNSEVAKSSQAAFAGLILFLLSSCLAKCSTLTLMMRLFNLNGSRSQNLRRSRLMLGLCTFILVLMAVWGVLAIIAVSVKCIPSTLILGQNSNQCPNQFLRWQLITAIDVTTEVLLVITSIITVWPIQLSFSMKLQIVLAFAFRLPLVALSILHLEYLNNYLHDPNPGIAIVNPIVLQQVMLCWSLISATIPNLRSFVKSFSSGFGIGIDMETYAQSYGSNTKARGTGGYELSAIKASQHSRIDTRSYNNIDHQSAVLTRSEDENKQNHQHNNSITDTGSEEMIIRKDVRWDVHYEAPHAR